MLVNKLLPNKELAELGPIDIFLDKKQMAVVKLYAKKKGFSGYSLIVKAFLDEAALSVTSEKRKKKIMDELTELYFDAANHGSDKGVIDFIEAGFDVNTQHPITKRTALHRASLGEAWDLVNALVKVEGINHLLKDKNGKLPCQMIITNGNPPSERADKLISILTKAASKQAREYGQDLFDYFGPDGLKAPDIQAPNVKQGLKLGDVDLDDFNM